MTISQDFRNSTVTEHQPRKCAARLRLASAFRFPQAFREIADVMPDKPCPLAASNSLATTLAGNNVTHWPVLSRHRLFQTIAVDAAVMRDTIAAMGIY